jgi:hypothetical protein
MEVVAAMIRLLNSIWTKIMGGIEKDERERWRSVIERPGRPKQWMRGAGWCGIL